MSKMPRIIYPQYLEALRIGSRGRALRISQVALAAGTDIRELYLRVFQPAMYEIGRLWETNQISVAQEHLATSITRNVMAQLHGLVTARLTPLRMFMNALKRTVVATCVGNEQHELGIRMVADFFELDGWKTYFLGGHMPALDIVHMVNERRVDVLALSVTLNSHVPELHELVQMTRRSAIGARIKILVGGQPFHAIPELAYKVGADITASDARAAVEKASLAVHSKGGQVSLSRA